jgi:hypothetical protein
MRSKVSLVVLAVVACTDSHPTSPTRAPTLHVATSHFAAQYGYLRSALETPSADPGVRAGVDQLAALERAFPAQFQSRDGRTVTAADAGSAAVAALYWRVIDALVFGTGTDDALVKVAEAVPRVGDQLDTAIAMRAVADALHATQVAYDRDVWPEAQRDVTAHVAAFEAIPSDSRDAAMRFMLETAGVVSPPARVDLLLVPRLPGKEGMTVRTPAGPVVVIGVDKYRDSDLAEVALHEALHVVDATAGEGALFDKLRAALRAAHRPAFEVEQVPHVCMFVLAAEAVRRAIDPTHVDVGRTFGAYARGLEPLRAVVEPELVKRINGRDLDATVAAIVAGVSART